MLRLVTIRSTDDLWPNVNPSSGPGGRLAQHRAWRGIVSGVQARVTRTAEWRRLRRAEGQLASLNDRMLKGRGPPMWPRRDLQELLGSGRDSVAATEYPRPDWPA